MSTEVKNIQEQKEYEITMSSVTRLKKIVANFKWTIMDFDSLHTCENKQRFPIIKSSTFFLYDNECEKSFQISFHYVHKYVHLKCIPDLPRYTTVKCSILNEDGKHLWQSQTFFPPLNRILLPFSDLIAHSKQTYYSPNNTLRLLFSIEIIEDLVTEIMTDSLLPTFNIFEQFLENQQICDVTFIIGNQELKAHKIILAARNPVFLAMFSHEYSETKNNIVTILDIRYEIFKALLQYIYNSEIKNIHEIAGELLIAADKYLMNDLKLKCEKILINDMIKEKAINLLSIAIQCKCKNLEACCRFFILEI